MLGDGYRAERDVWLARGAEVDMRVAASEVGGSVGSVSHISTSSSKDKIHKMLIKWLSREAQ